ncbi:MAG: ABC transporter ATP-binding protein [Candidatus Thermoplasmatota archaeon]|nr:ABC transporter ATP-binding protein [Candidatus Thermoplasmatota archaeon]
MEEPRRLLDIKNLRVEYRIYEGLLRVLNDVSFYVNEGEKIGIIGESSCGKTTTMKAIMGILASNSVLTGGEILYRGSDILRTSKKNRTSLRRKNISMIFQDPSTALNPVFKIRHQIFDTVKFSTAKKLTKPEIQKKSIDYLKEAALPEPERILDSFPFELSGGMKQRVNIAMALVSANDLLIADEPGTALDVTIEDQVMRLLRSIVERKNISVILITHALGTVKGFVDRVYVMYAGTIVESGKTKEIFSNPKHPYTRMLIDSVPKLTGGGVPEGIPGVVPSYLNPPKGCRFVTRCPLKKEVCSLRPPETYEAGDRHYVACFLYEHGEV